MVYILTEVNKCMNVSKDQPIYTKNLCFIVNCFSLKNCKMLERKGSGPSGMIWEGYWNPASPAPVPPTYHRKRCGPAWGPGLVGKHTPITLSQGRPS